MATKYQNLKHILGKDFVDSLASKNVLVVGAGGIGCELLKDLVLSGILQITVIDLDTIDLSNLNRQFLFQKQHINLSKAKIAKETVLKFNKDARITAHHASIFDSQFDISFFKSFDLVLNALDNLAARRYVNKMCLAASKPLIESGTAGYLGQVSAHLKGVTSCYDCTPKEIERKTYPVCTIRSTPSAPIHCIVWGKSFLFSNLFGAAESGGDEISTETTADNAEEIDSLQKEQKALLEMKNLIGQKDAGKKIFEKVFCTDIKRLLTMPELWKSRKSPIPLVLKDILKKTDAKRDVTTVDYDQKVWPIEEQVLVFLESIDILGKRLTILREKDPKASLEFDKDDLDTLNFVTATSNLRAHVYSIPLKSRFEVKQMAGNIIPAIATTNAIVAGMMVMLVFKLLHTPPQIEKCSHTFVAYGGDRNHFLMNEPAPPPNPKCIVCTTTYLTLEFTQSTTLQDLVDNLSNFLNGELAITKGDEMIYDIEFEDKLDHKLVDIGLDRQEIMACSDDDGVEYVVTLFCRLGKKLEIKGDRENMKPKPALAPAPKEADKEDSRPGKKRKVDDGSAITVVDDEDGILPIEID